MDPEVVSDHPGSCPKCGMALEPRTVSLDERPNPELVDMSRRFWVGLVLSLPLFALAMSHLLPEAWQLPHEWMTAANWVQMLLATPVVFWCGWPFFQRAATSVVAAQSEHVHPDCPGRRGRLRLQPPGHHHAVAVP